jgi:glucoamylase
VRFVALIVVALSVAMLGVTGAAARVQASAPDGPGVLSHFDLARKDCLGTARNTTSRVWYTVAGGVLSDVYYPTVDNTNVETLQYIVSDGSTFTDLQSRDMTYTVQALDPGGMECRVTATAKSGLYQVVTDYLTDPARNTVVMRVRFDRIAKAAPLSLYLRFDPSVNGNGGGGSGNGGADSATVDTSTGRPVLVASDPVTATNAVNRDYAQPVFAALAGPFDQATSGFAGSQSDGLVQLDAAHALTSSFADAGPGNVVQTARVDARDGKAFVLALGFGATQSEAVGEAEGSLAADFDRLQRGYGQGWEQYDRSLVKPPKKLSGLGSDDEARLADEYYLSANVIKASEDKTFPGAIVASLASPWGQAVSAGDPLNTYFGSYREVFARDLYEAWTGLVADGDLATARAATLFLFERQQLPDGSMPRNSLVNGKTAPDSFGTQLDECAYPILMADELGMTDASLYTDHIRPAANFVAAHGPSFGPERWEEQGGYSPSTIAAEIAGLVAAAQIADVNGDTASASVWRGVADDWQRSIKGWTLTTSGPLASHPYFIRLSKTGDPNAAITYNLGNGGPTLDQRGVVDAGFLELARLGELAASDSDILQSLPVVDTTIRTDTASGPGWHRYNGDGYGDGSDDGHPWAPSGKGTGHLWPVLTAERGEQSLQTGDPATAAALLDAMARMASGIGLIPEQDWELPDLAASPFGTAPEIASIGFRKGAPAGSAAPLTWSAASFVRLARDLREGTLVDRPGATFDRYVAHT